MSLKCFLAAGGTGGHLFPAQALSEALMARGYEVHLVTDERAEQYGISFPANETHIVRSATLKKKNIKGLIKTAFSLAMGVFDSLRALRKVRPDVVVGFGGYPTVPPLIAARLLGIPVILHEQNAVLGRANKILSRRASFIATSFPEVLGLEKGHRGVRFTGNPLRRHIVEMAKVPYPVLKEDDDIRLLIFGGSQGARFFSDVMPDVIRAMPENIQKRLSITQQCRPEDLSRVREHYEDLGIQANLGSFFVNLAELIAHSHFVIARSGATTVAELSVIGRPSLLIPFPHALDQDQALNAQVLEKTGSAFVMRQDDASVMKISQHLMKAFTSPDLLQAQAGAALKAGRQDAVIALSDLVEEAIEKR